MDLLQEEVRSVQGTFGHFIEMVSKGGAASTQGQAELMYVLDHKWKPPPPPDYPSDNCDPGNNPRGTGSSTPVGSAAADSSSEHGSSHSAGTATPGPGVPVGPVLRVPLGLVPLLVPAQLGPMVFKPRIEAWFDGSSVSVSYFLVAEDQFLRHWRHQFVNKEECIEYISGCFSGNATQWYVVTRWGPQN